MDLEKRLWKWTGKGRNKSGRRKEKNMPQVLIGDRRPGFIPMKILRVLNCLSRRGKSKICSTPYVIKTCHQKFSHIIASYSSISRTFSLAQFAEELRQHMAKVLWHVFDLRCRCTMRCLCVLIWWYCIERDLFVSDWLFIDRWWFRDHVNARTVP